MTIATGTDAIGRQTAVLLSLLPPLGGDRRLPLVLTAISTAAFLSLLPVADTPLAAMPGFGPAFVSSLLLCTLITAAVLHGHLAKVATAIRHGRGAPMRASVQSPSSRSTSPSACAMHWTRPPVHSDTRSDAFSRRPHQTVTIRLASVGRYAVVQVSLFAHRNLRGTVMSWRACHDDSDYRY